MQFLFANDPTILNVIHFGPFEYFERKKKKEVLLIQIKKECMKSNTIWISLRRNEIKTIFYDDFFLNYYHVRNCWRNSRCRNACNIYKVWDTQIYPTWRIYTYIYIRTFRVNCNPCKVIYKKNEKEKEKEKKKKLWINRMIVLKIIWF